MSEKIIAILVSLIASGGYLSVVVLMAIQSACIPIPSEVIMPLAGYALAHSQAQLILLATVASLASNLARFGSIAVLAGRMLPIVRTFIAFPAGVAKMNQARFHIYTFIGSWPWCYVLAYIGMRLGASWNSDPRFKAIFHRFHLGVEAVLLAGFVWFVVSHWKNRIRTGPAA